MVCLLACLPASVSFNTFCKAERRNTRAAKYTGGPLHGRLTTRAAHYTGGYDGPASSWPGQLALYLQESAAHYTGGFNSILHGSRYDPGGFRRRPVQRTWPQTPFPSYFDYF